VDFEGVDRWTSVCVVFVIEIPVAENGVGPTSISVIPDPSGVNHRP